MRIKKLTVTDAIKILNLAFRGESLSDKKEVQIISNFNTLWSCYKLNK